MKGLTSFSGPLAVSLLVLAAAMISGSASARPGWMKGSMARLEKELGEKYGTEQSARLIKGMDQVAGFWRDEDGGADVFEEFVRDNFAGDEKTFDDLFYRWEFLLEGIYGHMGEIGMAMSRYADLDIGPMYDIDRVTASYSPSAHIADDFFRNKLAFTILLNFPLTTLDERLTEGEKWTRRQWADARLAQWFAMRIPSEVNLEVAKAAAASDQYIADYNIWMHHLVNDDGERIFPPKMRLLSHWNLRDEIKADYGDSEMGLEKQRMIQKVMERIVDQTIPEIVVNDPYVDWNPYTNEVWPAKVNDSGAEPPAEMIISDNREPDTRYRIWLDTFKASRLVDEYSPMAPTLIDRRFDEDREIPEEQVEAMLVQVCSSPLVGRIAAIASKNLGRDLEPFDIWYNGFRSTGRYTEPELDSITRERYATADDFKKDMERMLVALDFPPDRAAYIAGKILVEPARGSGHAAGSSMCSAPARLRTRIGPDGMDYKGFNIAVHEMGHNVEQVLSLCDVDYYVLHGVPNTAFTEAFAFVFQGNDIMLLGLEQESGGRSEAMSVINDFWMTAEIGAVSLIDMKAWRWMYGHPDATPAEFRDAVLEISKEVWNAYFAEIFGKRDVTILAVYSHLVHSFLYLPDYAIGHMIAFQVKEQMRNAGNIGIEFERMAVAGRIAPDLWMKNATGKRVSPDALIEATERALKELD
jgi:hypothetical protein